MAEVRIRVLRIRSVKLDSALRSAKGRLLRRGHEDIYKLNPSLPSDEAVQPTPLFEKKKRSPEGPLRSSAGVSLRIDRKRLLALIAKLPDDQLRGVAVAAEAAVPARPHRRNANYPNGTTGPRESTPAMARFRASGRECAQPRFKNGKLKRPTLPPGLSWPTKRYSKERLKHGTDIVQYLRREWRTIIDAGFGELRWLRMVDPSAARAIDNYERVDSKTGKKARRLPPDLHFLTEREVTDRKLERGMAAIKAEPQLAEALVSRLRRGLDLPIF